MSQQTIHTAPALNIRGIEALVFRAPISTPVQTSFGIMHDRPAVYVRVTDDDGVSGWGEVWCNFPQVGAEHRARLLLDCAAPMLLGRAWSGPQQAFQFLTERLHILSIQSGEPGPIAQVIAGLDIALWDLAAKKMQRPLWQVLGGQLGTVAVYASGLNPTAPEVLAQRRMHEGYTAFKLKVGFGADRDLANLRAMRAALGADTPIMVDANQAWSFDEALRMSAQLADFNLGWLEEPIAADQPLDQWRALAQRSPIVLAAGENVRGDSDFDAFMASGALRVIQPDVAKWGGISAGLPLGRRIAASGARYCPHWLGGGVGLAASLHLKAAVGGAGMVEIDANDNPLRTEFLQPLGRVVQGHTTLPDTPGLGIEAEAAASLGHLVLRQSIGTTAPPAAS